MDHITATRLARCDAFIAAADAEHGGRYDYSLLPDEFVNVKTRVRIICRSTVSSGWRRRTTRRKR